MQGQKNSLKEVPIKSSVAVGRREWWWDRLLACHFRLDRLEAPLYPTTSKCFGPMPACLA